MNELEAARQVRDGLLPSPWPLGGMTLWALRITGTGLSFRSAHDEFVWRSPEIFLSDEFVARCNAGLPLIWEHPEKKPSLDSQEFGNRVIGTIMLAYRKNDEIWGIARVYDAEANKLMTEGQLSTSPSVVFKPTDGNQKVELNGQTFLIEGSPSLLDHLCVTSLGVWDKGGPPTGVSNQILEQDTAMAEESAEEKKAREDKARKDEEMMDRLDATIKRMDARIDAMEADHKARKDAEEAKEKEEREDSARKDAARKDKFGHRKDGESYKDWKTRHDADEAAMCDAFEKGGVEKDKARKDAKDCRMDAEEHERKDGGESFEKWAKEEKEEPEHKEDTAKKDADEEKERMEREDAARKDAAVSQENADLKRRLAAMESTLKSLTTEVPLSERDALAKAQFRADSVAVMFGERAPQPMAGETSLDYRKRLLKKYQTHSPPFKETRFDGIPGEALGGVEETIYADAVTAAKAPATARPGILMPIEERDRAGRTITKYVGDNLTWMLPYMSGGQTGRINDALLSSIGGKV